jgi:nucleoside-diphosphate-sugar epimerase
VAAYAPDGDNDWPNVHVDDLAAAYALAQNRAAPATILNATGGAATPRTVMDAIGRLLAIPSAAVTDANERRTLPFADWLGASQRISERLRRELGWNPQGTSLVHDLEHGTYRTLR